MLRVGALIFSWGQRPSLFLHDHDRKLHGAWIEKRQAGVEKAAPGSTYF